MISLGYYVLLPLLKLFLFLLCRYECNSRIIQSTMSSKPKVIEFSIIFRSWVVCNESSLVCFLVGGQSDSREPILTSNAPTTNSMLEDKYFRSSIGVNLNLRREQWYHGLNIVINDNEKKKKKIVENIVSLSQYSKVVFLLFLITITLMVQITLRENSCFESVNLWS